jgi:uncharacterized membrane protein YjjP (DUF1212 family)
MIRIHKKLEEKEEKQMAVRERDDSETQRNIDDDEDGTGTVQMLVVGMGHNTDGRQIEQKEEEGSAFVAFEGENCEEVPSMSKSSALVDGARWGDGRSDLPEQRQQQTQPLVAPISDRDVFEATCRLTVQIGRAAMKYGSTAASVESFLAAVMQHFGYRGVFRTSQSELFCNFQIDESDLGLAHIVAVETGSVSLHKLGLIAEMAKGMLLLSKEKEHKVRGDELVDCEAETLSTENEQTYDTISKAVTRLHKIDNEPDPWSSRYQLAAFAVAGAGLAMVYQGTWIDIGLSTVNGALVFGLIALFRNVRSQSVEQWVVLASAFVCSLIATTVKIWLPEINVALVTMAGVAVYLPGYSVTLGAAELVSSHIISGSARLIAGLVVLMWLVVGTWLGHNAVSWIFDIEPLDSPADPVSPYYQAVFIPMLFMAVIIIFQNSYRDLPWSLLCMSVAYGTSIVSSFYAKPNLTTFLSSVAMTVFANIWARCTDRPNTLILLPAFLLKVSGSIGFLGLITLVEGERFIGLQQFRSMFIIALLIIVGVLAGNTLVPTFTTL